MSLAASGRNAKLCGSDGKFAPTNIWKRGNGFGEWNNTYPLLLILKP
jgi:hypothetical protein